jgi:hypothetical protein
LHHACSKNAQVTVPSLEDWEKKWQMNQQKLIEPVAVQLDFHAGQAVPCRAGRDASVAAAAPMGSRREC